MTFACDGVLHPLSSQSAVFAASSAGELVRKFIAGTNCTIFA